MCITFSCSNITCPAGSSVEDYELDEITKESGLSVAGAYVAEGKFMEALDTYDAVKTPQSAYNASQVVIYLFKCHYLSLTDTDDTYCERSRC